MKYMSRTSPPRGIVPLGSEKGRAGVGTLWAIWGKLSRKQTVERDRQGAADGMGDTTTEFGHFLKTHVEFGEKLV